MPTFPGKAAATQCPGCYAGKEVWVRDHGPRSKSAMAPNGSRCMIGPCGATRSLRTASITQAFRWASSRAAKTLIHIAQSAPMVERRPLAAYDSVAVGGAL